MPKDAKYKVTKALFGIFLVAVVLRVGAYLFLGRMKEPSLWEYDAMAKNFLAGRGLSYYFQGSIYYAFVEPFYPLLSALIYWLTNYNYFALGLINILASGALAVAAFFLARHLFDESVGFTAAFLTAFHPGIICFSTKLHPFTFDALFITLVLSLSVKLHKTHAVRDALLLGLFIGMAFLSRTYGLVFILLSLLLIAAAKMGAKRKLKLAVCVIAVASVAVSAWTARNCLVLHKAVVTRTTTGYIFWAANNPNATGAMMYDREISVIERAGPAVAEKLKRMNELEQNKYFMDEAISFIRADPLGFLARWVKKFYYFWWFSPQAGYFYPRSWLIIYKAFYSIVLVSAAYGLALIFSGYRKTANGYMPGIIFTLIFCLSLALAQSFFYVEGRHRWVIEPVIMIFSSFAIAHISLARRARLRK